MNDLKIQQEILKAILANPQQVSYFSYDIDQVFVTTTGTVGYFMPADALRVNLTGAQIMADILTDEIADAVQVGNRLVGTDEYRKGGVARKYLREKGGQAVYIDTGLLKNFSFPELYQRSRSLLGPIIVTEHEVGADGRQVVGIVMPTKVDEENQ